MTPDVEAARWVAEPQEKQRPETWSAHCSDARKARQRLTLAKIRERIARAVYPEGFYFDRDTSREIDRLTLEVESLRAQLREAGR